MPTVQPRLFYCKVKFQDFNFMDTAISAATKNSCQLFALIHNSFLCHYVPLFQGKIIASQFPLINHTLNFILTKQKGQITQECSLCQTVKHLQEESN